MQAYGSNANTHYQHNKALKDVTIYRFPKELNAEGKQQTKPTKKQLFIKRLKRRILFGEIEKTAHQKQGNWNPAQVHFSTQRQRALKSQLETLVRPFQLGMKASPFKVISARSATGTEMPPAEVPTYGNPGDLRVGDLM